MSFRTQIKKEKEKKNLVKRMFIFFFIFLIIFLFRNSINNIVLRSSQSISSLLPNSVFDWFVDRDSLVSQIEILKKIKEDFLILSLKYEKLESEISVIEKKSNKDVIIAGVLSRPPFSRFDTLVLNKGTDDFVNAGDRVFYSSILLARITESNKNFSIAEIFSSPGLVFNGRLMKNDEPIELKGVGGGAIESFIPLGQPVDVGDPIIIDDIQDDVFGIVKSVENLSREGFKRILISVPVNFYEIKEVSIKK